MKQKLTQILANPKISISVALIIALVIGIISSNIYNKTKTERSKKITTELTDSNIKNSNTAVQDLTLAFPMGGRIKNVLVKIGDKVKAGTILASLDAENTLGAINQAKGAYTSAQTAYDKLINGTSTPDIEIARVALNNAKSSYNNTVASQKVLVANTLSATLNSGLVAIPLINGTTTQASPTISGTYTGTEEGTYSVSVYTMGNGSYFNISGLEKGNGVVGAVAVPLGTHGLYIKFPDNFVSNINTTWTISIPNTQSANYLTYYNAYNSALQNQTQTIATAQGAIDAAQAVLDQKVAGARSEDLTMAKAQVESTQGALQIAQGAYNNTLIVAPVDGTITNILITTGQVATPNIPVIELLSK